MTVTRTLVADAFTPVRAYAALRAADPETASFMFESVVGGERWGRFSILGYRPAYEATLLRDGWRVTAGPAAGKRALPTPAAPSGDPLADLDRLLASAAPREAPPADFFARLGASHFGYFAWNLVERIAKVAPPSDAGTEPTLARFFGGATLLVFDSLAQTMTVVAGSEAEIDGVLAALAGRPPLADLPLPDRARLPEDVDVDLSDEEYRARVRRAKEYIAAGDAFQIVLARTFSCPRHGRDPFDVYRAMRMINPSPYMFYLDLPPAPGESERVAIAGASPETMVRLADGTVTVRPIAGTRPRGRTEEEDAAHVRDLLADEKERAEHVMLVDLGRNDVGRVAVAGGVEVVKLMEIERYSHVLHIVSEVRGHVRPGVSPLDVVRAAFPAGTLSGAPKVRAMQIIHELEPRDRGIYGGAVGYLGAAGDLDLAIAIRTLAARGDRFEVTAGAGVVDASDAQAEADETRNKARAILSAIACAPPRS